MTSSVFKPALVEICCFVPSWMRLVGKIALSGITLSQDNIAFERGRLRMQQNLGASEYDSVDWEKA